MELMPQIDDQQQRIDMRLESWLKKNSHLNPAFYDLIKIPFRPEIEGDGTELLKRYDELQNNFGFLFIGNTGVGKTLLAQRICIRVLKKFAPYDFSLVNGVIFFNVGYLLQRIKKFDEKDTVLERCQEARFLFLDDLGAENATDFAREQIINIFDMRCIKKLPTFITTNLNFAELKKTYGERITSRIFELCIPIKILGADKRTEILNNRLKDLKSQPVTGSF